jgi:outer membrane protein OmpA-like peptidoglycan-associated protein/opacity protein-like surface antigen
MRKRLMITAWTLAACLPTLAMAQQEPAHREGSWEFSLGAGFLFLDSGLRDFLGSGATEYRFADSATPSRGAPLAVARLGYNFNDKLGLSVSGEAATGSGVRYYTPTAALTYTVNLNAKTSPFFMIGTELTRIEGQHERVTHSTWGALAGLGIRTMISDNMALRLEGRMRVENYDEVPMPTHRVYNPLVTLGFSFFTHGRQPATVARAATCPACAPSTRMVDTVRVYLPFVSAPPPVIVLRDTLVLEGVNFAFDESALTPDSHDVLDRVARELLKPEWVNVRFEVAGHTSSVASEAYNMSLSERRAEAVRAYLVSRGVQNSRMTAKGYGETQPIFPDNKEGDAWQNRRVELRRIR